MAGAAATPTGPLPISRRLALLAVPIAVLSVASAAGNVLSPHLLIDDPLLLVALSPRALHLAVAAGTVPLPVFLAVGMLRLMVADPWHYALGRMHGPAIAEALTRRSATAGRTAAWLLRIGKRRGLLAVALSPTGKVLMVAGASRIRPSRVAMADAGGTLFQLTALYVTGRPLVQAVDPSPKLLMILAVGLLLMAIIGPAFVGTAIQRRADARASGRAFHPSTVGA